MRSKFWLALMFLFVVGGSGVADELEVKHHGRPQKVTYAYYVPPSVQGENLPVLVCIGGLPMDGDKYLQSDPKECLNDQWKAFADQNHLAIVGLGFLFIPEDWESQESYQYPKVWSGQALMNVLAALKENISINDHELYLYGVSAGAQFSIRFAQMHPELVAAITAHAAGGFDEPLEYTPTKFLLTVGKLDNGDIKRLDMAREFTKLCRTKGIAIKLKVISGIAHRQTERQNAMSRQFLRQVLKERRRL